VPLRPDLQDVVDTLLAAGADGLSLDELADALGTKQASYEEVDAMIEQLETGGVDLRALAADKLHAQLRQVMTSARQLVTDLGRHPSTHEIAERAGLPQAEVRRALVFGRVLARDGAGAAVSPLRPAS